MRGASADEFRNETEKFQMILNNRSKKRHKLNGLSWAELGLSFGSRLVNFAAMRGGDLNFSPIAIGPPVKCPVCKMAGPAVDGAPKSVLLSPRPLQCRK